MNLNLNIDTYIALLSILISLVSGFFIAFKQGVFTKVKLKFYPSFVTDFKFPKQKYPSWLFINSCELPSSAGKNIYIGLPLTIENRANTAAEHLLFSLTYHSQYSSIELDNSMIYNHANMEVIKRSHQQQGELCHTVYEIAMIPPKSVITFFDFLFYNPQTLNMLNSKIEKNIFQQIPKEVNVLGIDYKLVAKNSSSKIQGKIWFISTLETDFDKFIEKNNSVIIKITELYSPLWKKFNQKKVLFLPWPRKFSLKLFYGHYFTKYPIIFKIVKGAGLVKEKASKPVIVEMLHEAVTTPSAIAQPIILFDRKVIN